MLSAVTAEEIVTLYRDCFLPYLRLDTVIVAVNFNQVVKPNSRTTPVSKCEHSLYIDVP
jgi:hypothetical protein